MNHTPGPWIATHIVHGDKSHCVVTMAYDKANNVGRFVAEHVATQADAHLIAAAPRMLELLKNFVGEGTSTLPAGENHFQTLKLINELEK